MLSICLESDNVSIQPTFDELFNFSESVGLNSNLNELIVWIVYILV
jgi:hypothetical protein